jgi:hypothetical protein
MFSRLLGFVLLTSLVSCASLSDREVASTQAVKNERQTNLQR